MRKVPGVTAVRVSLNEGLTVLDFNQGNTVTLVQLRTILKNSGFVSREARLEAIGSVTADGQGLVFTVSGTGEKFALLAGGDRSHSVRGSEGTHTGGACCGATQGHCKRPRRQNAVSGSGHAAVMRHTVERRLIAEGGRVQRSQDA